MKARFRLTFIILALITVLCAVALFGCTPEERKEGSAERIQVEDTHVYLAPEGVPSTYQLKPLVYPVETASQKVYYRLADNTDREFLEVSADGVLKARKLKQDEEENNLDIVVRIISAENSDVTLNITVTIETVEVERIIFNPSTVSITLHGGGVDLKPEFFPAHALTGRDVIYTSLNPEIATVNSSGHVTPVGIGVCSIWVQTPKTSAFEEQVESHVTINVTYARLDYRLDLISDRSTLRQIAGSPEPISFVLSQLDPFTDPNPTITWYVNNTTINDVGVKDSKVLTYTPYTLPVGEYVIRATITNSFETQEVVSEMLKIYSPITSIQGRTVGNDDGIYEVGDNLQIQVNYNANVYPPESYRWTIVTPSGKTVVKDLARVEKTTPPKGDLVYELEEAGTYTVQAEAVVKGRTTGVKTSVLSIDVGEERKGNDIVGVYFDGATEYFNEDKTEREDYSVVRWDPLPYETEYEVEIMLNNDATTTETLSSVGQSKGYFTQNSVRIPTEIAGLEDSYSIRIRGSKYSWTEWYHYEGGSISQGVYKGTVNYLEELFPGTGINRYIANMEEYGKLLNYLVIFRPESLIVEGKYSLNLFVPFAFEDIDDSVYSVRDDLIYEETEPNCIDAFKIFACVVDNYVESTSIRMDVLSGAALRGKVGFSLAFDSAQEPSIKTPYDPTTDAQYIYNEVNSVTHYAQNPRGEGGELPIDDLGEDRVLEVNTSNQLFLAVSMGYRPLPVAGSKAEQIYSIARSVLNSIISDDMSNEQKALAIYEWLSQNVTYDYKLADNASSTEFGSPSNYNSFYLEGVFIDHVAVCDGIAKAFNLLSRMEGIVSYKVVGEVKGTGVGHAWNIVQLSGEWYVVDATWGSEKATINGADGAQNVELLTKDSFGVGEEGNENRVTYGIYPQIEQENLDYAYSITVGLSFDSIIDSDSELTYYVSTHLYNYLDQAGTVWAEVILEADYLIFKGEVEAVYLVINNATPSDVEIDLYKIGNKLFIKYTRN